MRFLVSRFSALIAVFIGVFMLSSVSMAGSHAKHHGPKMSAKEKQCISLWKGKKLATFERSSCCKLAMAAELPPRGAKEWRDPKEGPMLKMLVNAKKHCARKGFKAPDPRRDAKRPDPRRDTRRPDPRRDTKRPDPRRDAKRPDPRRPSERVTPRAPRDKACLMGRSGWTPVSNVLSESYAISYNIKGDRRRVKTKFSNTKSIVCVGGKKVPVKVGKKPSDGNLGRYIRGSVPCKLKKNKSGKRVKKLVCR